MKTVTLIGGSHHKEKVKIENNRHYIHMTIPPVIKFPITPYPDTQGVQVEEYEERFIKLGCHEISNIFFLKDIDVDLWIKNLVIDYLN